MERSHLIPTAPTDLTAAWISAVLDRVGHDVSVKNVTTAPIGTGQMASSIRVLIDYDRNETKAPHSVVVKLASQDPNSRSAGARGAYLKEVRFYQELADALPVATPQSLWADIDEETSDFGIVLEDMQPAEQGDQIAGCTVEQLRLAAVNIAGLHAPTWRNTNLYDLAWLTVPRSERAASFREAHEIVGMVTPGFIDRYANRASADQIGLVNWFAANVDDWLANDNDRFALTHCDHRLDNLLFRPDPLEDPKRAVTVVDWQTVAVRNPGADISYLLGTSVDADLRRAVEVDIVTAYHGRLCELGVSDYSLTDCLDDYRTQTPHSLLLTILGSMLTVQTDRGDDMFMAMLHRSTQQMLDLDVR